MFALLLTPFALLFIPLILSLRTRARSIYGTLSQRAQKELILDYSPTELTTFDIVTISLHLLIKYLPFYGSPTLNPTATSFDLPPLKLYGPLKVTPRDVALFRTAVKPKHNQSESTNPFLLVALTTPLFITILTHPSSPTKPLGAVNTRNRFVFHDPRLCSSESDLIDASKSGQLVYTATLSQDGKRKKRGVEYDVSISVEYHGRKILTQVLSFLQFLPKSAKPVWKEEAKGEEQTLQGLESVGITTTDNMIVPADGPMLYAASCKDYNPIHISNIAARVLGFKGVIAHGNYTTALLVQDAMDSIPGISQEKEEAVKKGLETSTEPQERVVDWLVPGRGAEKAERTLEVAFVKPVTPLPAELRVSWVDGLTKHGEHRVEFMAALGSRTCVAGSIA